jgi:aspartate/methionine/tyrosine aminotransferase
LSPHTKVIAISSPHNPSGVLASEAAFAGLEAIALQRGLRVLVDEVYADTVPGTPPRPAALRSGVFVTTSSLTKAYGLASLRCGWAIASRENAAEIRRVRGLVDGSTPIPAERLAELAFGRLPRLRERALEILGPNRRIWTEFLESRRELACALSPASVVFPRFEDGRSADAFSARLFEEGRVAVVPGSFFGHPSHFRVSLGGATEALREGLARISRTLDRAGRA